MMTWYKKQNITIRAAIIGGGFAILAAIITGIIDLAIPNPPIIIQYAPTGTALSADLPNSNIISSTGTSLPEYSVLPTTPFDVKETPSFNIDTPPIITVTPSITPSLTPTLAPIFSNYYSEYLRNSPDCIPSLFWGIYSDNKIMRNYFGGCWDLAQKGIAAQNNNVIFIVQPPSFGSTWLYTPIQEKSVTIEFSIEIKTLNPNVNNRWGSISVGFLPEDIFDPNYGYFLRFEGVLSQQGKKPLIKISALNPALELSTNLRPMESNPLSYKLEIKNNILYITSNVQQDFKAVAIPFTRKHLWIGYNVPEGAELWAEISFHKITETP